jgi:hypothetical protein
MLIGLSVWLYKSPVSALNLGALQSVHTAACAWVACLNNNLSVGVPLSEIYQCMQAATLLPLQLCCGELLICNRLLLLVL